MKILVSQAVSNAQKAKDFFRRYQESEWSKKVRFFFKQENLHCKYSQLSKIGASCINAEDLSCYGMHADLSCCKPKHNAHVAIFLFTYSFFQTVSTGKYFFSVLLFSKSVLQNLLRKKKRKSCLLVHVRTTRRKNKKKTESIAVFFIKTQAIVLHY